MKFDKKSKISDVYSYINFKEEQMTEECEFKYGDIVEVSLGNITNWYKAKFIAYDKDANWKYIVKKIINETKHGAELGSVAPWSLCRKYVEPKPDLKLDTPVWVSHDKITWEPRHFKCWEGEQMVVFSMGKTSHTIISSMLSVYKPNYWSLTDPNKENK